LALLDRPLLAVRSALIRTGAGTYLLRAVYRVVPKLCPCTPPTCEVPPWRARARVAVEVRPSTLQGAGQGLFALECIEPGEVVGEYVGDVIDSVTKAFRLRDRRYLACTGDPRVRIDALRHPEVVLRYVCHHPRAERRNVRFRPEGTRVWVEATRRVEPGEELFMDYGDSYWRLMGVEPSDH